LALRPPTVDYTDRDFDALRARLIALVKSVFPDWTDFEVASFGNVLIEMYAFVGDVLTFYQDNLARESRLVTAAQRKNVMALARMLGYRLQGARAATAELVVELSRSPTAEVTIPTGTVARTQEVTEPVRFQLLAPVVIAAGANPPRAMAVVEHSKTHTQLFDARGLAGLEVFLDFGPYLDGSATVSTPQGAFSEVESFLDSGPNDLNFFVAVDQNDRAAVRFGNGVNGLPPSGTITITYKTGGGVAGNVDAERIVVIEGSFQDAFGNPVQVRVTNPNAASGGADRQTIGSAKLLATEGLRALTRTVAREDFEINARRLPGVARALMLTSNEDPTIAENAGIHLRLDVIVNTNGDVVLKVFQNDLSAHALGTAPDWQPVSGMVEFIDDHLGINSGSQPLTSGRGGFGFSVKDVTRRAYFDHLELLRQV
jgi:hypothetical protein